MWSVLKNAIGYGRLLVILQVLALTVLMVHAGPSFRPGWRLVAWGVIAVVELWAFAAMGGLTFRVHPEPKAAGRLCRSGPYRWVRHPMYTAVISAGFLVVTAQRAWLPYGAWLMAIGVLLAKMRFEEAALQRHYPDYAAYRERTAALFPGTQRFPKLSRVAAFLLVACVGYAVYERYWDERLFPPDGSSKNLTTGEAEALVESLGSALTIVDVRSDWEFHQGKLPRAVQQVPEDPEAAILVYCAFGYRSRQQLERLQAAGHKRLFHLDRGLWAWWFRGGSLEKVAESEGKRGG